MEERARAIASLVERALRGEDGPLVKAYVSVCRLPGTSLERWSAQLTREAEAHRRVARALRSGGPPVPERLVRAVGVKLAPRGAPQSGHARGTDGS